MKKVIFVIDTLRLAGAETALVSLLRALDPKKLDIFLFVFEPNGVLQSKVPDYVKIIDTNTITCGMTLELKRYFPGLVKRGKFTAAFDRLRMKLRSGKNVFNWDIAKKHIPSVDGEYDVAVGFLEGAPNFFVIDKIKAKKKIGWIHIDMTNAVYQKRAEEYYNKFDAIATISALCKDAFVNLYPTVKDKVYVIENIVSAEDVKRKADEKIEIHWDRNKTHIVTVGRLEYQKGIDIGAQSCCELLKRRQDICWHVFGQGSMMPEISQYIADRKLEEHFILEGLSANPYPYMKRADVIVQPSRWEGKSIVLDEAKILGKAIVVTNYPSVYDQITDGVTGLITEMTPQAIADGIERLMNDKILKNTLENHCEEEHNQSYMAVERFYQLIEN